MSEEIIIVDENDEIIGYEERTTEKPENYLSI